MNQVESQPLLNGEQIGIYEIKSLKHVGQTAILYHVKNEHMNAMEVLAEYFPRYLARRSQDGNTVECLSESQRTMFDRGLKRFLKQAERLSDIEHPNVARVYNTFQFNGTGYLAMDNEEGTPLIKLLKASTTFGQTKLEFLLTALLDGIRQTHEKGIVHGDIHPSNILIKNNGEPVLIDFVGNRLAAALDYGNPGNYLRSSYAAPELFEIGYLPKPEADIYALGATIYWCMTLTDPCSPVERLSATAKGEADPVKTALESSRGDYSESFLNTLLRMLEPTEDKRLQTADAVLLNLDVSDQESVVSKVSETHHADQQSDVPASRPSKTLWIGATAVVLLIVVGLWSSGRDNRKSALKTEDSGQEITEVDVEEIPAESAEPEMPKDKSKVIASKKEELGVPQKQTENHSENVTNSEKAKNAPVNEPSSVPEQPVETPVKSQTQAETTDEATSINEPKNPLSAKNDENQAVIDAHLSAAKEALTALHLTTPADNNAYSHYRAVLKLDSKNAAAKKGLQHIVDRYAWLINQAIESENYRNARIYLDRAKAIKPEDAAIESLQEEFRSEIEIRQIKSLNYLK